MIEDGLRGKILSIPAVTTIISQRVYPVTAPEDLADYPCVTTATVSYTADYTSDGATSFAQKRIVLNAYSVNYSDCRALVEGIRAALSGYRGALPDGTQVFLIQVANAQDFFESAAGLYRSSIHLLVQYSE